MSDIIEVKDIVKEFPHNEPVARLFRNPFKKTYVEVLHGINFTVKRGEVFTVMGPNGAGKTTIIKILAGLLMPTKGMAVIDGINLLDDPVEVRKRVSYVPADERSFYWRLSPYENLRFYGALYGMDPSELEGRIDEVLGIVDLLDRKYVRFYELSAGMRQRLSIARGLLKDPSVILMDEPTKGLDPKSAASIRRFIKDELSRKRKITIFWASHDMHEVEVISDRVMLLNKGNVVRISDVPSLKSTLPAVHITAVITTSLSKAVLKKKLSGLGHIDISTNGDQYTINIISKKKGRLYRDFMTFATDNSVEINELWIQPPTLEEAFMKIVGGESSG